MALPTFTLPEKRRSVLRQHLKAGRMVRAIECHNPLSAILGEAARGASGQHFDALWASGFANATALGLPDAEISILERKIENIAAIAGATSLPVIADADTGGDTASFVRLSRCLEGLGVSAVVVEDKTGSKRTSLAEGVSHQLEEPSTFMEKIALGQAATLSGEMMFFARIESLIAGVGMADALTRAEAYLAGCPDGIVIHSKDKSGTEIRQFLAGYRSIQERLGKKKPLALIPTAYAHIRGAELLAEGASLIIHGNHMIRAAFKAMAEVANTILDADRSSDADPLCAPVHTLLDTVGVGD